MLVVALPLKDWRMAASSLRWALAISAFDSSSEYITLPHYCFEPFSATVCCGRNAGQFM
jgi:hypothetical protein